MSKDLHAILEGWDYDPDEVQVRIVQGDDGREKLQMRLDLGLLQMELDGRPDGRTPHGSESLLSYHESQAQEAGSQGYPLDAAACVALMQEGIQYYHRYLALFHLKRFDLVARDTSRNLRLFRFVGTHAERDEDKLQFDQYRPYVTMMYTRAVASEALEHGLTRDALKRIDEGIAAIRSFLREYKQDEKQEAVCPELTLLRRWRAEIERSRRLGPVERLEEQLALAVTREQYEEAARLRDQIQRLRSRVGAKSSAIPDETA